MEEKREKSPIELILEEKIEKIEHDLDFYKQTKYTNNTPEEVAKKQKEIEKLQNELNFLKSRLERFKSLEEEKLYGSHETYNTLSMNYILRNIDPITSDKIKQCLSIDKARIAKERKESLEKQKENILKSFIERNVSREKEPSYRSKFKKDYIPIITPLKNKMEQSRKNERIKSANIGKYNDIINWIERSFIYHYNPTVFEKTYFLGKYEQYEKKINNPENSEFDEKYKEYEQKQHESVDSSIAYLKECKELLLYANLTPDLRKKVEKYIELSREYASISNLFEELRSNLYIGKQYIETRKEKTKIIQEYKEKKERAQKNLDNFVKNFDIGTLYNNNSEKIEQRKTEIQKREKSKEELKKPYVNDDILIANNKWEEKFIQEYIKRVFGREPTTEEKFSEKYSNAQMQARVNLRNHLNEINKELGDYLDSYLTKEIASYVMEKYQISDKQQIDFLVSDAMLSPQERYLRDMIEAKRMPKGSRVEDLTSKDLMEIEKHKDRYHDDECDKKIQELAKRKKNIKETFFTSIYKIEDIEKSIERIRKEENTFEEAQSYLKR